MKNLAETLEKSIEKEKVIYIMVEIRKFIDRIKSESETPIVKWDNLKYWCDWTVHTMLDRKFAVDTLNRMEKFITENPGEKFHWSKFNSDFISLEGFRYDLYIFLKENNLSSEVTNIPAWDIFTKYLVENLRDCPLVKREGLVREFRFIKKPHIPEAEKYSIDYEVRFDGSRRDICGSVLRFERNGRRF